MTIFFSVSLSLRVEWKKISRTSRANSHRDAIDVSERVRPSDFVSTFGNIGRVAIICSDYSLERVE